MKFILVNYNYTPEWIHEYTNDYLIFDRSDDARYLAGFPADKVIKTTNVGNVDYDKLSFLVDYYDTLPEVFVWGKTNLFKYITKEEFNAVVGNTTFTPLLTSSHRTYSDSKGVVCYYDEQGMYRERNDSWFLNVEPAKYVHSFTEWAQAFYLPAPPYIPFAPGGNYILTKERVHTYSRDFYRNMKNMMDYTQLPGEAHCAERSYYLMWQ